MAFYTGLRFMTKKERGRVAENLLRIRRGLRAEIPTRTVDNSLLVAVWNIRKFGGERRRAKRLPESYFYIAEILSAFDIIAIQEVGRDLTALQRVMKILGPTWEYFASDISALTRQRLVFLYDTGKVSFKNISGQIVLPEDQLILDEYQFARPPYLASFQSGWFKFQLCGVHIYYGSTSGTKFQRRLAEIDRVGQIMARRAKDEKENVILLGDFQIERPDHPTMQALTKHGFIVPPELVVPSNVGGTRYFSQIAFMAKENQVQLGASQPPAGSFNFFDIVFREEDFETYAAMQEFASVLDRDWSGRVRTEEEKRRQYLRQWRTFQMSDHVPLWVELKIDFSAAYLEQLKK